MDNIMNKQDLVRKIQELEFCAVDLNLFLDTHPTDTQALQNYNYIIKSLEQLKQLYSQQFGPFSNFGTAYNYGNAWDWVADNEKWPWEGNMEV